MDIQRPEGDNSNMRLLWTLPYFIILVGLFFSFASLSEFYIVAVAGEIAAYPWGPVNEVPWYYQNPRIYSTYNLSIGCLFLSAALLTVLAMLKKRKTLVAAGISLTFLLVLTVFINANIH